MSDVRKVCTRCFPACLRRKTGAAAAVVDVVTVVVAVFCFLVDVAVGVIAGAVVVVDFANC